MSVGGANGSPVRRNRRRGRHRKPSHRRLEAYAWLGAGGLSVAITAGLNPATAHADPGDRSGAATETSGTRGIAGPRDSPPDSGSSPAGGRGLGWRAPAGPGPAAVTARPVPPPKPAGESTRPAAARATPRTAAAVVGAPMPAPLVEPVTAAPVTPVPSPIVPPAAAVAADPVAPAAAAAAEVVPVAAVADAIMSAQPVVPAAPTDDLHVWFATLNAMLTAGQAERIRRLPTLRSGDPLPTNGNNAGAGNVGDGNIGNGNLGYGNLGSANRGNANIGAGNIGDGNVGFGNAGNLNIGFGNAGDNNIGFANTGTANFGFANTGTGNIGIGLTGDYQMGFGGFNSGTGNTGLFNSGSGNKGFFNAGTGNAGLGNAGTTNFGLLNAGTASTGLLNSGAGNTGLLNSGDFNTGSLNGGSSNTGGFNAGDTNTGWLNSGDKNTGIANSGDVNTGAFNTGNRNNGFFVAQDDQGWIGINLGFDIPEFTYTYTTSIPVDQVIALAGQSLTLPAVDWAGSTGSPTSWLTYTVNPVSIPSTTVDISGATITVGSAQTTVDVAVTVTIGPGRVTLADLPAAPGFFNTTDEASSGFFNTGEGGGSGFFNTGAGVSGLWNFALAALLGSLPGTSGLLNYGGRASGFANLGAAMSGVFNTGTPDGPDPESWVAGVANIGAGIAGVGENNPFNLGAGNFGAWNIGFGNIGNGNLGAGNTGDANLGLGNKGNVNVGSGNNGDGNIGWGNLGNLNIGFGNVGSGNAGFANTGDGNVGFANTGNNNVGIGLTGDNQMGFGGFNSGAGNTGLFNSGTGNDGFFNAGSHNTGIGNAGDTNLGFLNAGSGNTGIGNAGDGNTGLYNAGDLNTGSLNAGNVNTGGFNPGDRNTGWFNTGDANTGIANAGDVNTGLFITGSYSNGLLWRGFRQGLFGIEVGATLSELPITVTGTIPVNIPVTVDWPDGATLNGFTVADGITGDVSINISGTDIVAADPNFSIPLNVTDVTVSPDGPLLNAVIGGPGTAIPFTLRGGLGPVRIALIDMPAAPGYFNTTATATSGFFNTGTGGGSGLFNSGPDMSGLWNVALQSLLGSAVSGLTNSGLRSSGLANAGTGVTGLLNTGDPTAPTGTWLAGLSSGGRDLSGILVNPAYDFGLGNLVGDTAPPPPDPGLTITGVGRPGIPLWLRGDIPVDIPITADLGSLTLQQVTINPGGYNIDITNWPDSGAADLWIGPNTFFPSSQIPIGPITLDLPTLDARIGGPGAGIAVDLSGDIGPARVSVTGLQSLLGAGGAAPGTVDLAVTGIGGGVVPIALAGGVDAALPFTLASFGLVTPEITLPGLQIGNPAGMVWCPLNGGGFGCGSVTYVRALLFETSNATIPSTLVVFDGASATLTATLPVAAVAGVGPVPIQISVPGLLNLTDDPGVTVGAFPYTYGVGADLAAAWNAAVGAIYNVSLLPIAVDIPAQLWEYEGEVTGGPGDNCTDTYRYCWVPPYPIPDGADPLWSDTITVPLLDPFQVFYAGGSASGSVQQRFGTSGGGTLGPFSAG